MNIAPGNYIPTEYLPVLIIMIMSFLVGVSALLVGEIFRLRRPYKEKLLPYESGNPPVSEPRYRFNIKFYIIAMLFVIFDAEVVFMYPWAIVYEELGFIALAGMLLFLGILTFGFVYEWKKGALKWE